MSLLLARAPKEGAAASQGRPSGCLEIALDPAVNRTGDLWHICVEVQPHKRAHVQCAAPWKPCPAVVLQGQGTLSLVAAPAGTEGPGDAVLCLEGGCRGGLGRRWPLLPR